MTIHEQIIALLQGDTRDESRVAELIRHIAISAEHQQLFLQHIQLNNQIDQLVGGIIPTVSSKAVLWNRIEAFERLLPNRDRLPSKEISNIARLRYIIWGSFLFALLLSFGLGYWLGDRKTSIAIHTPFFTSSMPLIRNPNKSATFPILPQFPSSLQSNSLQSLGSLSFKRDVKEILPSDSLSIEKNVQIIVPNGGEHFAVGSTIPICWSGHSLDNHVIIEYSTDGGNSWSGVNERSNQGRSLWLIPSDIPPSFQCLMRVGSRDTTKFEPSYVREFRGHDSGAAVAEISPDGKWLATVGADAKVLLWNIQTGKLVRSMIGHSGYVTFAKFNREGTRFATCSQDGTVRVWGIPDGNQQLILTAQGGEKRVPWTVAFSPDGRTIATSNDDGSITFWDAESGDEVNPSAKFRPHQAGIRYLEYTLDGSKIIASSGDLTATIIDVKTGQILQRFIHHTDDSLGANPSREEVREAYRHRIVNGIQITPDGKIAITCGFDGLVKFWDAESGTLIRSEVYHGGTRVSSIAVNSDGKLLASVGYDGTAKIVDINTGAVLATLSIKGADSAIPMIRASFSPDGQFLAVAHLDGKATLWRLNPLINVDISDSFWSIEPCEDVELK